MAARRGELPPSDRRPVRFTEAVEARLRSTCARLPYLTRYAAEMACREEDKANAPVGIMSVTLVVPADRQALFQPLTTVWTDTVRLAVDRVVAKSTEQQARNVMSLTCHMAHGRAGLFVALIWASECAAVASGGEDRPDESLFWKQ